MQTAENTLLCYSANLITIFSLYPYRDFVKSVDRTMLSQHNINWTEYVSSRYRGMIYNPSQPLLLATPIALLYGGYIMAGGNYLGVFSGSLAFAVAKVAVATIAMRMSNGVRSYIQKNKYKFYNDDSSLINRWNINNKLILCIIESARYYGFLSFFTGVTSTLLVTFCWHGLALDQLHRQSLRRRHRSSFFQNFYDAFRIHSILTIFTNPIRNSFRSSLVRAERSGGVHSLSELYCAEKSSFVESFGVAKREMQVYNIWFFMNGTLRTIFKTSLPFAVTYSLFTSFGGKLGTQNSNDYHENDSNLNKVGRHHNHYFPHRYR